MMRDGRSCAIATLCCIAVCAAWGQDEPLKASGPIAVSQNQVSARGKNSERTLSADDGLSIIAAALDPKTQFRAGGDCSHLTHAIYQRAGFPYAYASSSDLYDGVGSFQRVSRPQPGDLIVWRGHAGIVVNPSQRMFFSFLRSGPGVDDWESSYWKRRGHARFFRYIRNPTIRDLKLSSRRPHKLVPINR